MGNNIIMPNNGNSQDNQVNSLIFSENGEFFTTSEAIAEGTGNQHKNVLELIRTYLSDLKEFNPVAFQTLKGKPLPQGGFAKSREIALLNEDQATFLMTLMSNSKIVVDFKKRLVKAFRELANKAKQATTPALPALPQNFEQALQALLDSVREKAQIEATKNAIIEEQHKQLDNKDTVIIEQKDVIHAFEDFIDNAFKLHDTMSVDYYCKLISSKQNHFGAVKFRSLMKISGRFVMNRDTYSYMPSQEMLNSGQMEYKSKQPYVDDNGVEHEHSQIRITKKGARTLYAICKKYQKFFKMNNNETRGYHYKPLDERRAFLHSLLQLETEEIIG